MLSTCAYTCAHEYVHTHMHISVHLRPREGMTLFITVVVLAYYKSLRFEFNQVILKSQVEPNSFKDKHFFFHLPNACLVFQDLGAGLPAFAGEPTSHVLFWQPPQLLGRCRLFLGPALCLCHGDDGKPRLRQMTDRLALFCPSTAQSARSSLTLLETRGRQIEAPFWGEGRKTEHGMCQALYFYANWDEAAWRLLEVGQGLLGMWPRWGPGHSIIQKTFGGVSSQAHVRDGLRAMLGRVHHSLDLTTQQC